MQLKSRAARAATGTWLAILLLCAASPSARAQKKENATGLYVRGLRACLLVVTPTGEKGTFQGTGVLIERGRRLVLTNYHVVQENDDVLLYFPTIVGNKILVDRSVYVQLIGKRIGLKGKVIARSKRRDLALIKMPLIPRGVQALNLSLKGAKPKEAVYSIGNPGASDTLWIYKKRNVLGTEKVSFTSSGGPGSKFRLNVTARMLFTDTPPQKGESGGPLYNAKGKLVGITQSFIPDKGVGLYVDVTEVIDFLVEVGLLKQAEVDAARKKSEDG